MPQVRLPYASAGQVIGLLGGSFDPPHAGHAHITREAIKRFGLDQVWWLVSPGNPLKSRGPASMARRMEAAEKIMQHPRVAFSDFEAQIGTRYTAETLRRLMERRPGLRFVWLMGADNLQQFHLWQDWQWIMENVPVGVLARPGSRTPARSATAAQRYERFRLPGKQSLRLAKSAPPAWCFINLPMRTESSTQIRQSGQWPTKA